MAGPPPEPRRHLLPAAIAEEIAADGGRVTFARFMELALTHPLEGYYSRADRVLGPRGDFSTAPRLAPAFNLAVARLAGELVDGLVVQNATARRLGDTEAAGGTPAAGADSTGRPAGARGAAVVELGAGEGDLASALLGHWGAEHPDRSDAVRYSIVDVGARLRARQRRALAGARRRGWEVGWAGNLREALRGADAAVVLSNEFIDVLPVHLIDVRGPEPREAWVELTEAAGGRAAREVWLPPCPEAGAEMRTVLASDDAAVLRRLTRDGLVELRPSVARVFDDLAACRLPACLLTIDYGEFFAAGPGAAAADAGGPPGGTGRPGRVPLRGRTLRGFFRHQVVFDAYERVGRQDLTADVDFAALSLHGGQKGFETVVFTTVAALLGANGGEERLRSLRHAAGSASASALDADREATVLAALLDEDGVGGSFKVMLQVKE